ncbi:elongation factor P [Buchnera aphidicola (Cinara tujafilina)]|uniref:Elongation factor P n=1 Tax=Buchnera aphidicola (Cinara tujafilina) TaxID=261317 RepID=F7WYW1_9GAMM|nr:elongation factor P [Buchnera aphidicola]AEH39611.1 elongation factor P [Buchnera aphidicola (Cinara tujafilina)]
MLHREFVKPGKGQAFVRLKIRELLTGKLLLKTFKSTDTFLLANITVIDVLFLYKDIDGKSWIFMNQNTFNHISVHQDKLFGSEKWLFNNIQCTITLWDNIPIIVRVSNFIHLEVKEVELSVKGDTINVSSKLVRLVTGTKIRVPLFIQKGDFIKIDTRAGIYISRSII